MERLPDRALDNTISVYKTTIEAVEKYGDTEYDPALDEVTVELLEELKAYREAEEQGLIFRFPFKVGDTIWLVVSGECVAEIIEHRVVGISIRKQMVVFEARAEDSGIYRSFYAHSIGKRFFLTKEEAEQALKEMEKKNETE